MKIFIHVMDLVGPQNACIGLGQELVKRGHQVYFLINGNFAQKFKSYSADFHILDLKPAEDEMEEKENKNAIELVTNNFVRLGFFDPLTPAEKIKQMFNSRFLQSLKNNAATYEPQIKRYVEQERPDVFIVDAKIMAPCIMNCSIPWVYVFCANPLGLFADERLPPFSSGLAIDADPAEWRKYRETLHKDYYDKIVAVQRDLCDRFGYPRVQGQIFFPRSPYLNIYQFPKELDYDDTVKLPEHYARVDAFVRDDPEEFSLPECLKSKMKPGDKLIFLSMGSMGSCNLDLMNRLVSILAKTPYYYIVSKGMLHEHYKLADNMWGDRYVLQTKIIPIVDLVIFHGGNNTLTETVYFGKPMIVMPLFYDQYNNAQRVQEKKFGKRIDPGNFTEEELLSALNELINDQQLKENLDKVGQRIRSSKSKQMACERIEQVVKNGIIKN